MFALPPQRRSSGIRARLLGGVAAACALLWAAPLRAESAEALGPTSSFGVDAQLTGGAGIGLDGKLDNYFLARARVGVLFATSPWIANLGLSVDVGALAGLGPGGELELNHVAGPYGSAGVARVDSGRWLSHLALGYTIFGVEWQHVFGGDAPHEALLFEVRLPLGMWWLQKRQHEAAEERVQGMRVGRVKPRGPTQPEPKPAGGAAADETEAASESTPTPREGASERQGQPAEAQPAQELQNQLAKAERAHMQGDHVAEATALRRAYALRPEPSLAIRLAAAELALGQPKRALMSLQRAGDVKALPAEEGQRAQALKAQLDVTLSQLRLQLSGDTAERDVVQIDGVIEPSAALGYDVPLDPGAHALEVVRDGRVIAEREFTTEAGELLRLPVTLE